jgi:phosphoglycolate phosphatase-like HAD superfamily hydrolase
VPLGKNAGVPHGLSYLPDNWRFRQGPIEPGPAVVFDIDGVLSDAASRQHFIEGGRRNWDAFFSACGDDPLIEEVARLLELLDEKLQVVLLTGRPIRVQGETLAWLKRYELRWDLLIMRDFGDYMAAREFKQYTVDDLRRYGFNLQLAFEDDRRNLEMFRGEGIPTVYIHSGYFD